MNHDNPQGTKVDIKTHEENKERLSSTFLTKNGNKAAYCGINHKKLEKWKGSILKN